MVAMSSRLFFKLGAILLGFLVLALVEVGLRIGGWWGNQPNPITLPVKWAEGHLPSAGHLTPPLLVEKQNSVVTSGKLQPFMPKISFAKQKTQGVKRIFSFGGSSTLGVPVEKSPSKTFPGQIQVQLQALGIKTESINLGGASFSSDHVRQLALESLRYDPDALVIYSGNNEYFQYMLELTTINTTWTPKPLYIERLHLFRAIASLFSEAQDSSELYKTQKQKETLLLRQAITDLAPIAEEKYRRTDTITQQVNQRYLANLQQIVSAAKAQSVPVFVVLIPANLLHPPELSLHNPELSQEQLQQWQKRFKEAKNTDCAKSIPLWTRAIQIDPWFAEAWYHRGMCKKQRNEEAQEDLLTALNLDMNPNRPPESLQRQLLSLDTFLISVEKPFLNKYGEKLFHDSCHLTPKGYEKLAESIVQAFISQLGWGIYSQPEK